MTSLQHLLPASDQAPRCADHTRSLAVDPGGTAFRADRVVLVETPGPWPKPVFDHPALTPIDPLLTSPVVPTRTLAYLGGRAAGTAPSDHPATVITFDRTGLEVIERRFEPSSRTGAAELATALAADDVAAIDGMAEWTTEVMSPVVLVCTQGSHDVCCGSDGARFAAEAESIPGLAVYRVSHTGGHRFAPTAMTLPDGRMWSDLDLDLLRRVLSRTGHPSEVVDRCRGWSGAEMGPAQVAERAVLALVGWELEDWDRTVDPLPSAADDETRWSVGAADRSWEVTVVQGRAVPTIACRQPGGLPAKPATEYDVRRIIEI